jgi:hypothetical protein
MIMELSVRPDEQDKYSTYEPFDAVYKQSTFLLVMENSNFSIVRLDKVGYEELFMDEAKVEAGSFSQSVAKPDANSRAGFSNLASEYRKAFYHFQRLVQSSDKSALQYNIEFQKNLTIKTKNILDLKELTDYFETQLLKLARSPKQVRKNWSEDETLLLMSMVAYFCCFYNEDFMKLVIHVEFFFFIR